MTFEVEMTARGVAALKPPVAGRDTYRDTKARGLVLVVGRRRRTWMFRYTVRRDGTRFFPELVLGYLPAVSLADAREQAHRAQAALDDDLDPAAALGLTVVPASARGPAPPPPVGVALLPTTRHLLGYADDVVIQPQSFGALAAAFLVHYAQPNKESWRDDAQNLRSYVLPYWRDLPAASITRAMVHARLDAIAERGSERRGPRPTPVPTPDGLVPLAAPVQANRVLSLISVVFNFGLDRGWVEHHPAYRIGKRTETPATRWLDRDEVLAVWDACERDPDPICAAALLLQLFTGQRGSMILEAEWPEFATPWWTIPTARVKNRKGVHRVPLGPLSLRLLGELQAAGYHGQYLFPHRGVGLRAPGFFQVLYDVLEAARAPLTSAAIAEGIAARGHQLPRARAAVTLRISCELSRRAQDAQPFVVRTPEGWALTDRTLRPVLGDGPLRLRTTSWREFTARVCRAIGFTPHDLRRTMTTHLGRLKVPREHRGKLLSHTKPRDVTARVYDQWEYDDEKMAAMLQWHDELTRWRDLPQDVDDAARVLNFAPRS